MKDKKELLKRTQPAELDEQYGSKLDALAYYLMGVT